MDSSEGKAKGHAVGAANEDLKRLSRGQRWRLAIRPKTLGLSLVPVLAGTWIAAKSGVFRLDVLAVAAPAAVAIQIGTNLWNDAADATKGTDGPDRLGPPRVTSLGLLSAKQVRTGAALAFLAASVLGLYLAVPGGWPILLVGLISLAMGYLYSMGPRPLSGTPLGEALVVAFFGVAAVTGTAYLHGLPPNSHVLLLGLVIGLPAAAVLLVNNHRDRVQDARSGRRTLAIILGERASRVLYAMLLLLTIAGSFGLVRPCALGVLPFVAVLALAAVLIWQMIRAPISTRLNRLILGTSAFQVLVLFALIASTAICGAGSP